MSDLSDISGTITVGGVAQTLSGANTARAGVLIQNVSDGDLWVNATGSATASSGSIKLIINAYYEFPIGGVPKSSISIYGASTGQGFTAKEAATDGNPVTWTDRSGTIAEGGSAQIIAVANIFRVGILVQNISSGDLWINARDLASPSHGSIKLMVGGYYEFPIGGVPKGIISIYGASSGQAFTAKEW